MIEFLPLQLNLNVYSWSQLIGFCFVEQNNHQLFSLRKTKQYNKITVSIVGSVSEQAFFGLNTGTRHSSSNNNTTTKTTVNVLENRKLVRRDFDVGVGRQSQLNIIAARQASQRCIRFPFQFTLHYIESTVVYEISLRTCFPPPDRSS